MRGMYILLLGFVTCCSVVTASLFADRPGSYDGVLITRRPSSAAQVSNHHPDHSSQAFHEHRNWRGAGQAHRRAPCYHIGWPRRSYSFLYVGYGPGYGYVSPYGYGYPYQPYGYPTFTTPYIFPNYQNITGFGTVPVRPTFVPAAPIAPVGADVAHPAEKDPRVDAPRGRAPAADAPARRESRADSIARKLRKSTETTRGRADRYVGFGDSQFLRKQYRSALQRYKTAIETAPDFPDAYYHEAYALIAIGQYGQAAKALQTALKLDPTVSDRFRLAGLYGDDRVAMTSHIESLARAALDRPTDPNLLMLVGLFLRDQGETAQAEKFLRKALKLAGPDATYLKRLLKEPPVADPVDKTVVGVDT